MNTNELPEWLTPDEVCDLLNIKPHTLNEYVRRGLIPSHQNWALTHTPARRPRLIRLRTNTVPPGHRVAYVVYWHEDVMHLRETHSKGYAPKQRAGYANKTSPDEQARKHAERLHQRREQYRKDHSYE